LSVNKKMLVAAFSLCFLLSSCSAMPLRVNEDMLGELEERARSEPPLFTPFDPNDPLTPECEGEHVPVWVTTQAFHMRMCSKCQKKLSEETEHSPATRIDVSWAVVISGKLYRTYNIRCECLRTISYLYEYAADIPGPDNQDGRTGETWE